EEAARLLMLGAVGNVDLPHPLPAHDTDAHLGEALNELWRARRVFAYLRDDLTQAQILPYKVLPLLNLEGLHLREQGLEAALLITVLMQFDALFDIEHFDHDLCIFVSGRRVRLKRPGRRKQRP